MKTHRLRFFTTTHRPCYVSLGELIAKLRAAYIRLTREVKFRNLPQATHLPKKRGGWKRAHATHTHNSIEQTRCMHSCSERMLHCNLWKHFSLVCHFPPSVSISYFQVISQKYSVYILLILRLPV